jgi:hypothetical protein
MYKNDRYAGRSRKSGFSRTGLRIGTLWSDNCAGEADVSLSEYFEGYSYVTKIDLLGDIIHILTLEYEELQEECKKHYSPQ